MAFVVMAAVVVILVTLASWSLWLAWSNPQKLLEMHEVVRREDEPPGLRRPLLRHRFVVGASIFGYGVFVYGGMNSALFWLPESLGRYDQDGDWASSKDIISGTFAVIGAGSFVHLVLDYCRLKLRDQWRREGQQN